MLEHNRAAERGLDDGGIHISHRHLDILILRINIGGKGFIIGLTRFHRYELGHHVAAVDVHILTERS